MKAELNIWWSKEDQAYLADVPEFPGCIAEGKTREEELVNLNEVRQLWLEAAERENRNIPIPKGRLQFA